MKKTGSVVGENGMVKSCCMGLAVALLASLLISVVSAMMLSKEFLDMMSASYIAIIIQFISPFIGAVLAGKRETRVKSIVCLLVSGLYFAIQVGVAILLFDGIQRGVLAGFVACLLGGILALMLCIKRKNRSVSKKRRYGSR